MWDSVKVDDVDKNEELWAISTRRFAFLGKQIGE
jgi:hypothetical protein